MPTTPMFEVDAEVYLRESAAVGFLEAYRIDSISLAPDGEPVYTVKIQKKPNVTPTFADKFTNKSGLESFDRSALRHLGNVISFRESELVSKCEAARLALANLTDRAAHLQVIIDTHCPGTE